MNPIPITRSQVRIRPDPLRLIIRPFVPGTRHPSSGRSRVSLVVERVRALPDADVASTLSATRTQFKSRHVDLDSSFERNFQAVANEIEDPDGIAVDRRLLIGAYFSHEYAIEAAAISNPSIVPAPDQSGLQPGEQRFTMSLRAIGEGHLSSIEFRSGVIDSQANVTIDQPGHHANTGERQHALYANGPFRAKLTELGVLDDIATMVLGRLASHFTMQELEACIAELHTQAIDRAVAHETTRIIHWVAASNYALVFAQGSQISERVIFPSGPTESQGMEDARFVRFTDDDGALRYYGIYTAFDGSQILPQLIETADFVSFRIVTLNGHGATNKGMALFPRMIDSHYVALSRQDNENNFVMFSDDVRFWYDPYKIQAPERPWELLQLGNGGSPLETEAGWLVITHGVGPMRRYTLGAILLDIDDPRRVIGHLKEPLLVPIEEERDGYVPNVVYSCGSMIHGDRLVIPYGFSDVGTGIATAPLGDILDRLTQK